MFLPKILVKDMAQMCEYNSEKNAFKVMCNLEMTTCHHVPNWLKI